MFKKLVILAFLPVLATASPGIPDLDACRAAPTSACMAEIAIAVAMARPTDPNAVEPLALMGRLDALVEITQHHRLRTGQVNVGVRTAHYRMLARLAGGDSLHVAMAATPDVRPASLYWLSTALLDPRHPPSLPENIRRTALADLATLLVETGHSQPHVARAARIFLELGQEDRAHWALANLPARTVGDYAVTVDFEAIGPAQALAYLSAANAIWPEHWLEAARASSDPTLAQANLDQGMAALAAHNRRNRFDQMAQFVELAHQRGFADSADRFLTQLLSEAEGQEPRPLSAAAQALISTDASISEIAEMVAAAETLATERVASVANLWLQTGNIERAITLLSARSQSGATWSAATGDRPFEDAVALVEAARAHLSETEFNEMRARIAFDVAQANAPPEAQAWAIAATQDILAAYPRTGYVSGIYDAPGVYIALASIDPSLSAEALLIATDAAFDLWTAPSLIQVAHAWYLHEQTN